MSDQLAPSPLPSLSTTATSTSTTPGQPRTPDEAEIAEQKICTPLHALYCFDVLASHFENRSPVDPPFHNPSEAYGLFVTWNTTARRYNKKPSLRGCIGNFSPAPISKGLRDYALVSAIEDHRFPPIKSSELPHLQCAVSLLTPFTPIADPLDWTPGQHGIHITFPDPSSPKRTLSATYLPEIATDQGWSREETILSAIQKAGYNRPVKVGDEVWRSIKTRVYESSKAGCTWDEYVAWKGKDKSEGGDQE